MRRVAVFALALGALLAGPALASADEGLNVTLRFPGSNGYSIIAGGQSAGIFLYASRAGEGPPRRLESSTYIARGEVSSTAIRGELGDLGTIAMRFHPSGRVVYKQPRGDCRGRRAVRLGVFVGSIHFRGEDGYTSADVHRAKGRVTAPAPASCSGPARKSSRGQGQKTRLGVGRRSGLAATYFAALREDGKKTRFAATIEESKGRLAVYRAVYELASPLTFAFDDALSFAGVTPPPPFSGSGVMQRDPAGVRSWTGSLAVSFPGKPDVPLTGPGFKTQLARSW